MQYEEYRGQLQVEEELRAKETEVVAQKRAAEKKRRAAEKEAAREAAKVQARHGQKLRAKTGVRNISHASGTTVRQETGRK